MTDPPTPFPNTPTPTQCDPDFGRPTVNLTLYDGCNVRIGGTLVSAYLEGTCLFRALGGGPVVDWLGQSSALDRTAVHGWRSLKTLAMHVCNQPTP